MSKSKAEIYWAADGGSNYLNDRPQFISALVQLFCHAVGMNILADRRWGNKHKVARFICIVIARLHCDKHTQWVETFKERKD
jgi:hypothetical protein